ncbi:hypothetical protein JZ751_003252 [Albula glossodonta]|uniref:Uncharacterized protein n=1 Tax=Albula glossodonta TaxID=121402 RepID=A0A8T2MNB9_9TELE|nr:hypothetical protein JZ751_003252 [Albula glossodonta]
MMTYRLARCPECGGRSGVLQGSLRGKRHTSEWQPCGPKELPSPGEIEDVGRRQEPPGGLLPVC